MERDAAKPQRDGVGSRVVDFLTASVARTIVLGLVALVVLLAITWEVGIAWLGFGPETMWVNLHYAMFIVALFVVMFLLDLVYLPRAASPHLVRGLKIFSLFLFLVIVIVSVLGVIPDIPFDSSHVGGTWTGQYGSVTANVSDSDVGNLTGPLLFDMMEHTSLILPPIWGLAAVLVWHYGPLTVADPKVKRAVLALLVLGIVWTLVLAIMGVVMVKTLTFPPGV